MCRYHYFYFSWHRNYVIILFLIQNIFEADRIWAMVDEYGLAAFNWAFEIAKKKRPKVALPYLEEVLKNRDGPTGNDPVAGAAAANKILESGEIIDFNGE